MTRAAFNLPKGVKSELTRYFTAANLGAPDLRELSTAPERSATVR